MPNEYLNNPAFERIIAGFRSAQGEAVEPARLELARAFYLLARNIARSFRFAGVEQEDAVQEGVWICFQKLHRFDTRRGRAFNFCTTVILNHYRALYRTAKNFHDFRLRYGERLRKRENG